MNLLSNLSDGEVGVLPISEDSNSLEISEKPITDTGQVVSSGPTSEEDSLQVNGTEDQKEDVKVASNDEESKQSLSENSVSESDGKETKDAVAGDERKSVELKTEEQDAAKEQNLVKPIETSVITTSPLKLTNLITETKRTVQEATVISKPPDDKSEPLVRILCQAIVFIL